MLNYSSKQREYSINNREYFEFHNFMLGVAIVIVLSGSQ